MKALPATAELLRVARRVVWFEEPVRALADPVQFLAHVMVFGSVEDLKALQGIVGKNEYRKCWSKHRRAFSTRGLGRTGIWFVTGSQRQPCRCAPGWSRSDCRRRGNPVIVQVSWLGAGAAAR
jgi:hypothetical protein